MQLAGGFGGSDIQKKLEILGNQIKTIGKRRALAFPRGQKVLKQWELKYFTILRGANRDPMT